MFRNTNLEEVEEKAFLVEKVDTVQYFMIGQEEAKGPQHPNYQIVKEFKNVPKVIVSMLAEPKSLGETLQILSTEQKNTTRYSMELAKYASALMKLH